MVPILDGMCSEELGVRAIRYNSCTDIYFPLLAGELIGDMLADMARRFPTAKLLAVATNTIYHQYNRDTGLLSTAPPGTIFAGVWIAVPNAQVGAP